MKKLLIPFLILSAATLGPRPASPEPTTQQYIAAYSKAVGYYKVHRYRQAKSLFGKIGSRATVQNLGANSLYLFSQCALRTGDYNGTVKSLTLLAQRWPDSDPVRKGLVSKLSNNLIGQVANLQTDWNFNRRVEETDLKGNPVWVERTPTGQKVNKRINFKLGFGLYKVLTILEPYSPATAEAKRKLDAMLNAPITLTWVDEKVPDRYGHPGDFVSPFSQAEKEKFSQFICSRVFYDWETDKLYQFLDMYDDVRNQRPRFIAKAGGSVGKPGSEISTLPVVTLAKLFQLENYDPYANSVTVKAEAPTLDNKAQAQK